MITNSVSVLLHSHPHFRQTYVASIVDILVAILVSPVPLILCICLCFHHINVAYGLYFSGHFDLIDFSYPVFLHAYASTKSVLLKLHVFGTLCLFQSFSHSYAHFHLICIDFVLYFVLIVSPLFV